MQQIAHKVIGIVFWLVLAGLWLLVVLEDKATTLAFRDVVLRISIMIGVILAVTTWWIRHNVEIYRRKGPRHGRATVTPRVDEDRLGRPIRWSMPGGARTAPAQPHLVVDLDGDVKVYRRAD